LESTEQVREAIEGTLKDGAVGVADSSRFGELEEAGYGERDGKVLLLKDYEALYLVYAGKLKAKDGRGRDVTFEKLRGRPGAGEGLLDQVHHLPAPEVEGVRGQGRFRVRD